MGELVAKTCKKKKNHGLSCGEHGLFSLSTGRLRT